MCNIPAWIYLALWGLFSGAIVWSHIKDSRYLSRQQQEKD